MSTFESISASTTTAGLLTTGIYYPIGGMSSVNGRTLSSISACILTPFSNSTQNSQLRFEHFFASLLKI